MLENILKSVTEAEAKADAMIGQAEQEAIRIIEDAKQQASMMKEDTLNTLKVKNQELLKSMQNMSSVQLQEAARAADGEAESLKASIISKKKEAIEEIIALMI